MANYSRILVCISNPRHIEEMTRVALASSVAKCSLVFLRVVPVVNDWALKQFNNDLGFVKKLRIKGRRIRFEKRLAEGSDAKRVILETARKEKADLIVMGATPHKNAFDRMISSISTYVMNNAKSAVVLVKGRK